MSFSHIILTLTAGQNTGKRIVFHVYNNIFGETSYSKDNKIVNFIILYTKHYIYLCLKQKRIPTLCELIHIHDWKICLNPKTTAFNFWKMVVNMERLCLYLIKMDIVFKLIQIYHIFRFKYAMVWMKVWKKSASIKNNSNLCVTCTFIYVHLYTYSTCLKWKLK